MQQKKSGNTWLVCGIIAVVVLCLGAGAAAFGFGLFARMGGSTTGISVMVEAPGSVDVGETFTVGVTVQNQGSEPAVLEQITLPVDLLQRAPVTRISLKPSSIDGNNYHFDLSIPAESEQTITFTLKSNTAGAVSGDVAVVSGENSATASLALTVAQGQASPTQAANQQSTVSPGDIAGVPYKAVVQILALVDMEGELQPGWSGSGSIITSDGLVLTNAHVVLSDRYYTVQGLVVCLTTATDQQPEPTYYAKVMQVDQALDIAVIKIEADLDGNPVDPASLNLPTVPFGDDGALNLGDPVTILGYPSIGGSTITLTRGEVAGFTAEEGYGNRAFIKTSATISGGNSGGLAANEDGEIIGIPTQLGYGGDDQYVDCRVLADTNRDGVVDESDNCVPTGGFINALRPLHLAQPLIDAARRGEVNIKEGVEGAEGESPEDQGAQVIFEDDFSDPNSGWDDSGWEEGEARYTNGEYQITVKPERWLVWSYLGDQYDDLIISVDTRIVNPTGVGDYGVIARFVDDSNYYAFEVSEDGYFSIWKNLDGETVMVYDWEFSDAIPVSGQFTISVACVGNRLLLGVNDVLLADITDDSFTSGKVGLITGTLDTPNFSVAFDNFTILEP